MNQSGLQGYVEAAWVLPIVWIFADVVAGRACRVDLDIDAALLRDVPQDGLPDR